MDTQQPIRRRDFIATSAVAGVTAGTSLGSRVAAESDVSRLSPAQFENAIGETFATTAGPLVLERCDVQELPQHDQRPPSMRQPFSLLFSVTGHRPLEAGTFELQHPTVGRMSLNVCPSYGPDRDRHYVEAVFG